MLQDLQDRSNDPHKANHVFQYASLDISNRLWAFPVFLSKDDMYSNLLNEWQEAAGHSRFSLLITS
jgi:hypothetical protein